MTDIVVDRSVMVPMPDGIALSTDVYRPANGPCPVLLHRTPYGKDNVPLVNDLLFAPLDAVEEGFAVVVQDVRGTGGSEGEFAPLTQERADGHAAIAWAAGQPWCDGSVGLYGSSYMGATALQAAVDAPAALGAVFAYVTGSTYRHGWLSSGSVFEAALNVRWTIAQVSGRLRRPDAVSPSPGLARFLADFGADPLRVLAENDPSTIAAVLGPVAPFFVDWLSPPDAPFWEGIDVAGALDRVTAPVMHVAGWYDGFLGEHLELQRRLSGHVRSADHRFLVGPWTHDAYFRVFTASTAGSRDFGPVAVGGRAGLRRIALDWFRHWLVSPAEAALPAPVRYFHMGEGANDWHDAEAWPPAATVQRWYLRSGGRLDVVQPASEPSDSFVHDPADPAPTTGGAHMAYGITATGVADQRALEARDDVVVYTSAHLVEPVTVVGPVLVEVYAAASSGTAQLCATLVDVDREGAAVNVADGVAAVSGAACVTIDLHATAYTFGVGHRIRLHLTGSSFPRLDLNRVVTTHHIHHDGDHPSALYLPVTAEGAVGQSSPK